MIFSLISQRWYLILQDEQAELFIYSFKHLRERILVKSPQELVERAATNPPFSVIVLVDRQDQLLEVEELPKATLLERDQLIKNYLLSKAPAESWFGRIYLKNKQHRTQFISITFLETASLIAWLHPLKEKGIKIRFSSFMLEAKEFLLQEITYKWPLNDLILFLPWDSHLKQILILSGNIHYIRRAQKLASSLEYETEIASLRYYIKRQYHLSNDALPIIFIHKKEKDEIPTSFKNALEIQDLFKSVIQHIEKQGLSNFKMLNFPTSLKAHSLKNLVFKPLMMILATLSLSGVMILIRNFLPTTKKAAVVNYNPYALESPPPSIKEPSIPNFLFLGGILYVQEDLWTIWLNDQKITSTAIPKSLPYKIERVTKHQLVLSWQDDMSVYSLTLAPNQTYIRAEKRVKEGDWRQVKIPRRYTK